LVETLAKRTFYLCNINDSVRIDIKNGFNKFEWFDGDTVNKFRYFKNVSNLWIKNFLADGSNIIDSIQVLKTPNIFNKIINDTNICEGENIIIKLKNNIPTYLWNNNATDSFFTINKAGKYWVKAQENRCSRIDTFDVNLRPKPLLLNYSDTFFCKNESIEIGNINYPNNYTFIWNNGLKTKQITVNKNTVPGETRKPMVTSGIRIGTPAVTSRGFGITEMKKLGKAIALTLKNSPEGIKEAKSIVENLCHEFPVYTGDLGQFGFLSR
jgi:hypothetical protein